MKKLTVFNFCSQIGAASDEIPVVVKAGMQEIGRYRSLYKIPVQAMPGVLDAKIAYVTLGREEIIIQIKIEAKHYGGSGNQKGFLTRPFLSNRQQMSLPRLLRAADNHISASPVNKAAYAFVRFAVFLCNYVIVTRIHNRTSFVHDRGFYHR